MLRTSSHDCACDMCRCTEHKQVQRFIGAQMQRCRSGEEQVQSMCRSGEEQVQSRCRRGEEQVHSRSIAGSEHAQKPTR